MSPALEDFFSGRRDFTIIDVFKALKVEPIKHSTWPAGAAMRNAYKVRYGEAPKKFLRRKTAGAGSHCFAIYPIDYLGQAVEIVRKFQIEEQRQGDLF